MHEHYFNVSHEGRFLFRTDWELDPDTINEVRRVLLARFRPSEGFCVSESKRSTSREHIVLNGPKRTA